MTNDQERHLRNMKTKEKATNEFHAYWQCPACEYVNMDIADNFLLDIREFKCCLCGKKYSLKRIHELEVKDFTQVLCQPSLSVL